MSMADSRNGSDYTTITRNNFPEDFVFGTGTAAYQVEGAAAKGGRGLSIWDVFTLRTPGNIKDGSNGNMAVDMYNRYKEDIKNMKNMGFEAYRFSISWPRILPGGKLCFGINQEGIDHYNDLINTLITHGIEPHVTLFHWDLPHILEQEYKGFLSNKIVDDFRDFAELCFREFGDRVKKWATFNEQWSYCTRGYVDRVFPPADDVIHMNPKKRCSCVTMKASAKVPSLDSANRSITFVKACIPHRGPKYCVSPRYFDGETTSTELSGLFSGTSLPPMPEKQKEAFVAAKNMLLAHLAAVESYNTHFKARQKGEIGITLVTMWFEPYDSENDKDHKAARRVFDFMVGWFLDPVLNGEYPENMRKYVPLEAQFSEEESNKFKENGIDFLGLNYYTARYAKDNPHPYNSLHAYKKYQLADLEKVNRYKKPIGEKTDLYWLKIAPRGIYKLLKHVNDVYNTSKYSNRLPAIYIAENGMAESNKPELTASKACADPVRVKFFQDHLGNILDAMKKEHVNVIGYFAWSWVDNFEWTEGYNKRFGINYIDYKDNLKRHPKQSARWFSKFLIKSKNDANNSTASDDDTKDKIEKSQ